MLTAQQRAQFDEAVAHSDISKSLEEASGWLHAHVAVPPAARTLAAAYATLVMEQSQG